MLTRLIFTAYILYARGITQYDPFSWTEIAVPATNAPAPREGASFTSGNVLQSGEEVLLLFGGASAIQTFNDLWVFRPQKLEWHPTTVSVTADRPSPRRYATLTAFAKSPSNTNAATRQVADTFYLYGGETPEGLPLRELWKVTVTGDTHYKAVWSQITAFASPTAPVARSRHIAVATRGALYIFGGQGRIGPLGDLWEWQPETAGWVLTHASGGVTATSSGNTSPVPRSGAIAGVMGGGIVVFGGDASGVPLGDTWRFDLTRGQWSQLSAAGGLTTTATGALVGTQPTARTGGFGAVIPSGLTTRGGLMVAGGLGGGDVVLSDSWRYVDASTTGARWELSTTRDALAVNVLAGGGDGAWGGSAQLLTPSGVPAGRRFGATAVAAAGGLFVFGGRVLLSTGGSATESRDLLFLGPTGQNVWSGPSAPAAVRVPIIPVAPSPFVPVPSAPCPDPGVPRGTSRTGAIPPFVPGDVLRYTCLPGSGVVVGDMLLICLGVVWSNQAPTCSVSAPAVPAPILPSNFIPPVSLTCDAPPAGCCPLPSLAPDVVVSVTLPAGLVVAPGSPPPTVVPVGTRLTYTCQTAGYVLIGSATEAACTIVGSMSAPAPVCALAPGAQPAVPLPPTVPIGLGTCPDPGVPSNGIREGSSFVVGSVVRFSCLAGYLLRGASVIACGASLRWTGDAPKCVCGGAASCGGVPVVVCPYPGAPVNGFASVDPGQVVAAGATVSFSCAVGYTLDGPDTVTCKSDGSFDFSVNVVVSTPSPPGFASSPYGVSTQQRLPRCVRRLCGRPPPITGADTGSCTNTPAGEWCNIHCLHDSEAPSGPLWCSGTGEWTVPLPYCMQTSCAAPPNIENGMTGHCAATRPGQECEVACVTGTVASGRLQCEAGTGKWATPFPKCVPRDGSASLPASPILVVPLESGKERGAVVVAGVVGASAFGVFLVLLLAGAVVLGLLGLGRKRAAARKRADRAQEYAIEVRENDLQPPPPPPRVMDQRLLRDASLTVGTDY